MFRDGLLDPPIDWNSVQSPADVARFDREAQMVSVIEREVYSKNRKVLFLVGGAHLARKSIPPPVREVLGEAAPPSQPIEDNLAQVAFQSPLAQLESRHRRSTFVIGIYEGLDDSAGELDARLASLPNPSLVNVRGTWLGTLAASSGVDVFIDSEGTRVEPFSGLKIQDTIDAFLYLGGKDEFKWSDPATVVCQDAEWLVELQRRAHVQRMKFDRKSVCAYMPNQPQYPGASR